MIRAIVDSRIRIPLEDLDSTALEELKRRLTDENPDFKRNQFINITNHNVPQFYVSWDERKAWGNQRIHCVTIPRGANHILRDIASNAGVPIRYVDRRTTGTPITRVNDIPDSKVSLYDYQKDIIDNAIKFQNCCVRSGTGSGKTTAAIGLIGKLKLQSIVIVWSANLFEQWITRIEKELGIPKKEIGIISGKKRIIKPITVAMQQTLLKSVDEFSEEFGVVICDECFEADTPILMEDGTTKRIADIQVNDVVAIGGKVKAAWSNPYSGEMISLNGYKCTPNHPVATKDGWMRADLICSDDVLWYHNSYHVKTVCNLSVACCQSKQVRKTQGLQYRIPGRCLCEMWSVCFSREEGASYGFSVWNVWALEQRSNCGFIGNYKECCYSCNGAEAPTSGRENQTFLDRECGKNVFGDFQGTESEVFKANRDRCFKGQNNETSAIWKDCCVWWEIVRERNVTDPKRIIANRTVEGSWVSISVCDQNWFNQANALQNRFCESRDCSCFGIGRVKPRNSKAQRIGYQEGFFSDCTRLEGSEVQGTDKLFRDFANVQNSHGRGLVFNFETERNVYVAAGVVVHNCQRYAAKTFTNVIDKFPAKYRIGFSADETRKDKKEFLIYHQFGPVAADIDRDELIDRGFVLDVEIRVIPTEYDDPEYRETKDFDSLLKGMQEDDYRNRLALDIIKEEAILNKEQVFVMSHRREHCLAFDQSIAMAGVKTGILIGGPDYKTTFEDTKEGMLSGRIRVGVGTVQAIGQGLDIPSVGRAVVMTPIANNRQQFGQVRGRVCRTSKGKTTAILYYLWDKKIYGNKILSNLAAWNNKVSVRVGSSYIPVDEYIKGNPSPMYKRGGFELTDLFDFKSEWLTRVNGK